METTKARKRPINWYLINIKARNNQTPSHYVDVFKRFCVMEPVYSLPRRSSRVVGIKDLSLGDKFDENGLPKCMTIDMVAYTIIDPDKFYNKRTKEDLKLDWDSDIASNKKEAYVYFIPSVHILAVRKSGNISLNSVLYYFRTVLEEVEPQGFDVDAVKDRATLNVILDAHKLISIDAQISFSNPGNTEGFRAVFESKMRNATPDKVNIKLSGSEENPLTTEEDGLISSIVNISEANGSVKASLMKEENSKIETIDTNNHPTIFTTYQIAKDIVSNLYESLLQKFNR